MYGLNISLNINNSFVVKSPIGQLPCIIQNNIFTNSIINNNSIKFLFVNIIDPNDTDNIYIKCV